MGEVLRQGTSIVLLSYVSGIETLRRAMTGTNPELESYASGTKTLANTNQSNVTRLEPVLSGIQTAPIYTSSRSLTNILPNSKMLSYDSNYFVGTYTNTPGLNDLYTIGFLPEVPNYWSGTKTLANLNQTNITGLTAYTSGTKTLTNTLQTGLTGLTTYASGIETLRRAMTTGSTAAVESYASGINSKLNGSNKRVITHPTTLSTLNAVYCDSSKVWQKSKANVLENAEVVGVVESTSGNQSTIVMNGVITNPYVTAGVVYYLSDVTAGALQTSEATNISKPVMIGIDSGVGVVQIFRSLVTSGTTTNPPDVPTGTIIPYGGASAPSGYLLCDGTAYSRATYAELFAIIGISYGNGNGSSTFNVPDLRGRTVVGSGVGAGGGRTSSGVPTGGTALTSRANGDYFGEESHVLTVAELAQHNHSINYQTAFAASTGGAATVGQSGATSTGTTGSNTAHNTMQPSMVTNFIIKASSQTGSVNVTYPLPRGHLAGYGTAPYTTSGIEVSAGSARSDDNEFNIITSNSIVKKLTGPFVAGTLQNGIDSGNRAASTTYHVHEITDGTNVDTLFSTSATSPTLPSGYVAARRIFSFKTNSTGFIPTYLQNGNEVLLASTILDVNNYALGTAKYTPTLSIPSGIRVSWVGSVYGTQATTNYTSVEVFCPDLADVAPVIYTIHGGINYSLGIGIRPILSNILSQIALKAAAATTNIYIETRGWIDTRGRDN